MYTICVILQFHVHKVNVYLSSDKTVSALMTFLLKPKHNKSNELIDKYNVEIIYIVKFIKIMIKACTCMCMPSEVQLHLARCQYLIYLNQSTYSHGLRYNTLITMTTYTAS